LQSTTHLSSYFLFSFSLHDSGHLRNLHSFPTRRSSDLESKSMTVQREQLEADVLIVGAGPAGLACALHLANLIKKHHTVGGKPEDRKSTRLNSSHVEISYAVFCLKKKKKK